MTKTNFALKIHLVLWLTVSCACSNSSANLPPNCQIDKIVVLKSQRKMMVYQNNQLLKTYTIALGLQPVGKKHFEGDYKTPEGNYYIESKNQHSAYHRNLGVSYPNAQDQSYAKAKNKRAGGEIKIHGLGKKQQQFGKLHFLVDWTHGCIAVDNQEIEELYKHVAIGTPIDIEP